MTLRRLSELPSSCFDGVFPAALATVGADGLPNATWLSHVFRVDDRHVALSCQFFRKTRINLEFDPRAQLYLIDPQTFAQWRLDIRLVRSVTEGPLFDTLARRLNMIAAMTKAEEVFALRSADVFEVMLVSTVDVVTSEQPVESPPALDPLTALARITEGISACRGLESLVPSGLEYLSVHLGLEAVSLYLADERERSLDALASRGYPVSGVGARVPYGVGVIGTVAQQRTPIRIADMKRELHYGRVVRERAERVLGHEERELPLPGLPDARSLLAVPLMLEGELFGVLSSESTRTLAYVERDVMLLQTAGQVLAQAIARALDRAKEALPEDESEAAPVEASTPHVRGTLRVKYYEVDDSVFLDGEYLIKGLPGRILWLLLSMRDKEGRDQFSNRELRLHPVLKLPAYKDNLEARLLMLQRRLQDKTSALSLQREQRGRLRVVCDKRIEFE